MKVCIVAASELELEQINCSHPDHEKHVLAVGGFFFSQALLDLLIAQSNRIELIVLVGIAGCTAEHSLGSNVLINKDHFGDMGVISNENFESLEDLGFETPNDKNDLNIVSRYKNGEAKADAITVNTIFEDDELNKVRLSKYDANMESMEGAYFHYLCEKYKIPYLHIRGLSNYIGERDKSKWKIKEAITSYSNFVNKELAQWI